jgi:hypothetical protein
MESDITKENALNILDKHNINLLLTMAISNYLFSSKSRNPFRFLI